MEPFWKVFNKISQPCTCRAGGGRNSFQKSHWSKAQDFRHFRAFLPDLPQLKLQFWGILGTLRIFSIILPLPCPRASNTGSCPPAPSGTLSWCDDRLTSVPQPATPAPHLPPPGLGLQIARALPGCALEGICKNLGKGPKERRENWKKKKKKE